MRQKIKKNIKKNKNELTPNHSGVLLEEMNSNLKLILEDHTGLNKKINNLREEMNFKFDEVNSNFKTVFEYLSQVVN